MEIKQVSADKLNSFYKLALDGSASDFFYKNLYSYFDFILNTHELREIWEKSRLEYIAKLDELDAMDLSDDQYGDLQNRYEQFSLWSKGLGLYMKIYQPIEYFKTSQDLDFGQNDRARVLLGEDDCLVK